MIGVAGPKSLTAFALAFSLQYGRLDAGGYAALRAQALEELAQLDAPAIELPESHDAFVLAFDEILFDVSTHLQAERSSLGGDTVALPYFLLATTSVQAATELFAGGEIAADTRRLLEACLDDLWLAHEVVGELERELGWAPVTGSGAEATIATRELVRAALAFFRRVLEESSYDEADEAVEAVVLGLRGDVEEFRREVREQGRALAEAVRDGDAETLAALAEVRDLLVERGLTPAEADALTLDDPVTTWERLQRWLTGERARDAAEEILWAALDFVPGGTGVKLGIGVARAVRKALKKRARTRV